MNCPYCGEKTDNSEFCHKCGNRLITHTITTDYELSDTKELETYIDKNSSKILNRRFSIPSFFLGSLYYLYRKMYFLAIFFITLSFAYSIGIYYIPEDYKLYISLIYLVFSILFNIVIAIKFNSIYISHANKSINKIKNRYKDKSRFEVMERIKYSGSTNLFAPTLAILIIGLLNTYIIYKQNDVVDNLSNAKYKVAEGYRETDAEIELNEDSSFIWYSNNNNKEDNFFVGKYQVYVGRNAINEAKRYKLSTDRIQDKNSYYILKLNINRQSVNGEIINTNTTLIYYGLYDNKYHTIDLNRVGMSDYFRLVKVK